jgi:hypothetical protein
MYCLTFSDALIHRVMPDDPDEMTMCDKPITKTLTDEEAIGQCCDDCLSHEITTGPKIATTIATDIVMTRLDEIKVGDYLAMTHLGHKQPTVYCVRTTEQAHDRYGLPTVVVHCNRGFTLTGTAPERVPVLAESTRSAE